jgi:HEAT repeat protein
VPHLLAIAGDETRRTSERARAISALGNFATDDVKVYLTTVLTEQAHNSLQRNALRSLARTGGAERLALIASFLAHEDSTLREASAHALGLVGTDEAHAALQARRAAETSEAVIAAIDEELAR